MTSTTENWASLHEAEFSKAYFKNLNTFLANERKNKQTIYPPEAQYFAAFDLCPWNDTRVVIIGQDPYHGPGQAQGLSFSVNPGIKVPPSLKNIYKELHNDLNLSIPNTGDLRPWAQQGVLLLNSTLSVRHKTPASHSGQGWETFTDHMIQALSEQKNNVVFLLWGKFASGKKKLINTTRHLVLEAPHPSPFSAHRGFFGCKHFSQVNQYLTQHNLKAIDWQTN